MQTSCTILPIQPDGSRPAWHVPGANRTFEIEDVDWGAVDRAAAIHLGGLTARPAIDGEPAGRLLARARAHGALTTADFLIVDDDGERTLPAHDASVVDTTGCGDAFCAGVIVARLAGWSIDHAAELGCATGALNMRGLGSDAGARDVDEALAFMRDAPLRSGPSVSGDPSLGRLRQLSEAG